MEVVVQQWWWYVQPCMVGSGRPTGMFFLRAFRCQLQQGHRSVRSRTGGTYTVGLTVNTHAHRLARFWEPVLSFVP